MKPFNFLGQKGSSLLLLFILFVLPFITTSGIIILIIKNEEVIKHFSLTEWILLYSIASFCMALAITHTTFIALASGFFLGFFSIPFIAISYTIASIIGYYAVKALDKGKFYTMVNSLKGADRIINHLKKDEAKVIFFARLSPVLPFAMTNALLSILDANLYKLLFSGFWGMLPRTILFVWIGSKAAYIKDALEHPQENTPEKILFVVLLIASITGIYYYINRSLKNKTIE